MHVLVLVDLCTSQYFCFVGMSFMCVHLYACAAVLYGTLLLCAPCQPHKAVPVV